MKVRVPLYVQTLGMLSLYLAALVAILFLFFNAQFGIGWETLLKSPVGDRVDTIAGAINAQLRASPPKSWNDILKNFGEIHHANFYVFDIFGTQIAGEHVELPMPLRARLSEFPPMGFATVRMMGPVPPLPPMSIGIRTAPGFPFGGHHLMFHRGSMMSPPPPMAFFEPHRGDALFLSSPPPGSMHAHGRFLVHTENPDRFWIATRVELVSPEYGHSIPALIIASTSNIWQTRLLFDFQFAALAIAIILVLSLIFWWPFVYQITRALSELTSATERIAEGRFDTRLNTQRRDEIGRLSEAVNTMAVRLNSFVTGQKRFLGDISHELCSPIARLQVALALLDESLPAQYRKMIADVGEEVEEINVLVHELLAYSKAGLKEKDPELRHVNLKSLLDNLLARLNAKDFAAVDVPSDLNALADPLLLDRSIANIVRNSVRYASDCGPITIKAARQDSELTLLIKDNGPGVPEEALKHLGEPFYRPEPSRSRNSGGVGLGLAIVKSCVEACGGSLLLRNGKSGGLEVEMRLKAC